MKVNFIHWIRRQYISIVKSIAFYPALIALCFLVISIVMLKVDFSTGGKIFKTNTAWIRLQDADTARIIVSTITAGIISLTVFSFSMVMIVLNQAAAYMSNRILQNLVGNRSQQIILGIYIGTIMYALFLLSSIRDIDTGTSIPALSIFLLILLTVIDIFIFIYFLHFITQSIQFQTIIHRIEKETLASLKSQSKNEDIPCSSISGMTNLEVSAPRTGYYQGFNQSSLCALAEKLDVIIELHYPRGSFILQGAPFISLYYHHAPLQAEVQKLLSYIDFHEGQPIERNPFNGFKQLVEVALKALSTGINDPSTAVLSLNAITRLLAYRLEHPGKTRTNENERPRLISKDFSFHELFYQCLQPIWAYGSKDQYIQDAFLHLLHQLKFIAKDRNDLILINNMLTKVNQAKVIAL